MTMSSDEKMHLAGKHNPFPGLRPFTPDESDLFFGRENESNDVVSKLQKNSFVTVIGASGSGKSSLIYCGVIPRIIKGKDSANWIVLTMRPGNNPLENLTQMFAAQLEEKNRTELGSLLLNDEDGLTKAVAMIKKNDSDRVLILIDQFEELFRFRGTLKEGSGRKESRAFVNLIVKAVNEGKQTLDIIITMRSDYIGECAHYQGLTDLINNSNYLIPHMAPENYRQAILGPVKYAGATIEPELVDALLEEIGEKTDQLPVLQHALMRTWSHWKRMENPDKPISFTNYDAVGQMSEAMSRHANEAFEELDARGKEICEVLFKTITEKGNDNKGIRHPTKLKTIASIARCSEEELIKVIDQFRQAGRSFVTPGPGVELTPESVVDVSHESLMRVWGRLSEWVDEEAASVQMYLRLSEASEMFQAGRTTLWRPPDLQLALNWRDDNMPTLTWAERYNPAFERAMVYLRTSEKEYQTEEENKIKAQKRQLRRSRITAMILGTAAIISLFFMLYAFVKQMEAEKNRQEADAQREEATRQQTIALAQADTARMNMNLARENEVLANAQADTAKMNADLAMREQLRAEENARQADQNAQEARRQEVAATENAERATQQQLLAEQNEAEATRLRMISIGKNMAVKSVQAIGQGDIQALLAYQAYIFNKRNNGAPNDADIYMGLYNVAKTFGGSDYRVFEGLEGTVKSLAYGPGQGVFYTAGADGKVLKWNISNNGGPQVLFQGDNELVDVLASSPDGKYLACGSDRSVIRLIPVSGSGVTVELDGHTAKIKSLVFSPDSRTLFSSAIDGQVLVWDVANRSFTQLRNDADYIVSMDVSADGRKLAGGTRTGLVRIWNLADNTSNDLPQNNGEVTSLRFRDDKILAIGFMNGMIDIFDTGTMTLTRELKGHAVRVTDIRFNEKFAQMATGSLDSYIKIWNMNDLTEPPISLNDNDRFVYALAFSPDGKMLLSGGGDTRYDLILRPTHIDYMVQDICGILSRNFTQEEWAVYVGRDIEYEETCNSNELSIKIQEKRGE